jgi:hypothetical protein
MGAPAEERVPALLAGAGWAGVGQRQHVQPAARRCVPQHALVHARHLGHPQGAPLSSLTAYFAAACSMQRQRIVHEQHFSPQAMHAPVRQVLWLHAACRACTAHKSVISPEACACACVPQVLWLDMGSSAWATTDSSSFYIDLALRSAADARFDGKRPRLQACICALCMPGPCCDGLATAALHGRLLITQSLAPPRISSGAAGAHAMRRCSRNALPTEKRRLSQHHPQAAGNEHICSLQ